MKKVTLSAVIMALVMMGCSESGEDNSMASMTASDVRNEQIQKNADFPFVLKKVSDPVGCGNGMTRLSCLTTYYHGSEHLSYTFWIYSNGLAGFGAAVLTMDISLKDSQGILHHPKADFVHMIAVNTCGCRIVGNQLKCKGYNTQRSDKTNFDFFKDGKVTTNDLILDKPSECSADSVGVVANYAVVFNAGKPTELVLAGNTFDGHMFDNMSDENARNLAIRVYQKYILEPYGDK